MRLQRQLSRKIGDKEYSKYALIIPSEDVKRAGFVEGQELKVESREGTIIIRKISLKEKDSR